MELSKKRSGVEEKFYNLCSKVVPDNGLKLYDMEYVAGSYTLKVFIFDEKTGTAVIEDCVKIDRALTPFIDELDWVPDELILEVSSPGMFRELKNLEHFQSAIGEIISCTITGKLDSEMATKVPKKLMGAKKFRGKLESVTETNITLNIKDFQLPLAFEQIKKASLDPDY
jgi:ribosome maturation factor RimP